MKLLIIRHAIAVERGSSNMPDRDRPLTENGIRRFRQVARALAKICPRPDLLLSSPLLRAATTADIAAEAWGGIAATHEPVLAHGGPDEIISVLSKHADRQTIAIVGHEPGLSALLAQLLGGHSGEPFALRKGGAALVELPGAPADGGRLDWLLRPKILRRLS